MVTLERIARNGVEPHVPVKFVDKNGHGNGDLDNTVQRNLRWGLSIQVQKLLALRPLDEIYKEQNRTYLPEGSEERKALELYYVAKHLYRDPTARGQTIARIGEEATKSLGLIEFYEDYRNGPVPDLFGKLQEEFYFVSQSFPKTRVDIFAEKMAAPIRETIGAVAAGIIYSVK